METERKYTGADFVALRARFATLGATTTGPHFESNTVFDTATLALFNSGKLLRLRLTESKAERRCLLTFKYRPSQEMAGVKAREELELEVADNVQMALILGQLGYLPKARYQKLRESWRLAWQGAVYVIELDTVAFGEVVEIEGNPERMDSLAEALGLDKCEISLKTYHELNQEWRAANGLPKSLDLLFEPKVERLMRLRAGLIA